MAYIATRVEETALAEEADSLGTMEDEADEADEEKKFAEWTRSAGEHRGAGAGVPLAEEVAEESTEEGSDADEPLAPKKKHILRRAGSAELVRPSK